MPNRSLLVICLVLAALGMACAGGSWKQALREDSPAAYYRFMRDHPGSKHVDEAQQRLEYHQLRSSPSLEAYEQFRSRYPDSPLLADLQPVIEEQAFARARLAGTVASYEAFVAEFPGGPQAARARGNAAYLEIGGANASVAALARFADQHPQSDFTAEARRSVAAAATEAPDALRRPFEMDADAVAVAAGTGRALILAPDGSFRLLDLSDPARPSELARHVRPGDLKQFDHVMVLDRRVVVHGADGIEVVEFGESGPEVVATLARGDVGDVNALVPHGDHLLVGGSRGLLRISALENDAEIRLLARGPVRGVAASGERVVYSDGEAVMLASLAALEAGEGAQGIARLRLGRQFEPGALFLFGNTLVVLGAEDALVLDVTDLRKPRPLVRLGHRDFGRVHDVVQREGIIYLLGDRGLQRLDIAGLRVVPLVETAAHERLAVMGRHLVAIEGRTLQVVDTTGLVGARSAAAQAR